MLGPCLVWAELGWVDTPLSSESDPRSDLLYITGKLLVTMPYLATLLRQY